MRIIIVQRLYARPLINMERFVYLLIIYDEIWKADHAIHSLPQEDLAIWRYSRWGNSFANVEYYFSQTKSYLSNVIYREFCLQ